MSTLSPPIKTHLTREEAEEIRKRLGREPNPVEWGMFDIMYSEHCSYKSSRPMLSLLPSRSPRVVVGPGYDSGIVDIGDGYVVAFKVESHNHPSAIEPYNGAATGVGGIVRDVLCVGARPIALLDSLRFGNPRSGRTQWLFKHVVRGIGDYGNCIGVPTVAGEVEFDSSFETNCLVNVACVGLAKREDIILAEFKEPGDILVLVGGPTGRDGIHGVTFASKTIGQQSEEDRPAVQIGDPFTKKLLIEAVLEALKTGQVRGLKDLGGGGLTCAASEMSFKGGRGVELNLDRVHVREEGMTPYELVLSESQERMLFAVNPQGLSQVLRVFEKYGLSYSIVGKVTEGGNVSVFFQGEKVAEVPSEILAQAPVIRREAKEPSLPADGQNYPTPKEPENLNEVFLSLLALPNIASQEWVFQQYDHEVGVRSVVKPGEGDAAVLRLLEIPKAIALKADCNSRHAYLDPFYGHAGALAEAARNVVCVGAEPVAYADCCNFGNPEKPEIFWQFKRGIEGLAYMGRGLGIPCVGGNVSFYNEDSETGVAVKPSTVVVMLGLIEDLQWITTLALKNPGDCVLVVGETRPEMGGSEYYCEIHRINQGRPPAAEAAREKASLQTVLKAIRAGYVSAAHDCSKGGLAVALALMAVQGKLGLKIELEHVPCRGVTRKDELLFSETYSRFILAVNEENVDVVLKLASREGAPARKVGRVVDDAVFLLQASGTPVIQVDLAEIEERWREAIPRIMEGKN
ncbi:phosphoribosylformylglycinamidine synthase subunit PurL [Candidatus Hecatella orcuttiae]|jgi:phosphoribosylformylglycinamidine synthase|uniref:phosphoribosylformylglycinamidine synthase subunit PurL n=1 Tax=Candidatus Hecatella orcuttiae TaxID=1935119 RepID=UPI002867BFD2|nr:phosphoribosylformylglycinamidine synthase subunit PurL [Candidatus Hecatella orcuttiae]